MAQEVATSVTPPEGAIWQAWLDAFIHPKFATFQRWFPLMKVRWRSISLAASLVLILVNLYVHGVLDAFTLRHTIQAFDLA